MKPVAQSLADIYQAATKALEEPDVPLNVKAYLWQIQTTAAIQCSRARREETRQFFDSLPFEHTHPN